MSANAPLDDLALLASVSAGMVRLAGDRQAMEAIDAETELWQAGTGGMMWNACDGPDDLAGRLRTFVRRSELTDRQRAIASILQARCRRLSVAGVRRTPPGRPLYAPARRPDERTTSTDSNRQPVARHAPVDA